MLRACLPALLLTSAVHASPLLEPHLGGMVLVGPTSPHPSSTFWNPAALAQAQLRGSRLFLSGNLRYDRTTIRRDSIDPATGAPGGSRTFDPVTTNVFTGQGFERPGMIAAVSDLGTERYRFGLSLYTPFYEEYPEDEDALGYHTRGGYLRAEYATGSIAVRATGNLFIGAGFSIVFTQSDFVWQRDRGLEACPTPPCEVEDPALAERIDVDTDNIDAHSPLRDGNWYRPWRWFSRIDTGAVSLAFNAGLMFRLPQIPNLWIGAAWISFPTFGGGTLVLDGGKAEVTGLDGEAGYRLLGDARTGMKLPQMVHVGARYELTELSHLVFAFRWVDLSRHGGIDVRIGGPSPASRDVPEWIPRWRGLQDVFSLEGGFETFLSDRLRGGGRLRLETSGVPSDALAPHQVDAPKADLAVGGELRLTDKAKLTFGYSLALLLPQETGASEYDPTQAAVCRDSDFDLDACAAAREGRAVPTAAGEYSRMTHELVVGLEFQWGL